ncbi:hypothetical protein D6817_01425 [Candidatus Pacearchaeota archaeon]|nr:MAG: hypothetical protein D6817_01425 [Candidatus Pacearchaeota archaeon]
MKLYKISNVRRNAQTFAFARLFAVNSSRFIVACLRKRAVPMLAFSARSSQSARTNANPNHTRSPKLP